MNEHEMVEFERLMQKMQSFGYAVVVVSPEELEGADPERVEERLIEESWNIIGSLTGS